MKNIVLASALALGGGISTFATSTQNLFFHDGIMDLVFQEDFVKIAIKSLPSTITEAVEKDFPNGKLTRAYSNDLQEYKLVIARGHKTITVYADDSGNWINK